MTAAHAPPDAGQPHSLPVWRLNALRVIYALLVFGLGSVMWPIIFDLSAEWPPGRGVANAMLASLALLGVLGLRYPVLMLPLLFFELTWKTIWLARVAFPLWASHRIDAATTQTMYECLGVVLLYVLFPWRFIAQTYGTRASERWR